MLGRALRLSQWDFKVGRLLFCIGFVFLRFLNLFMKDTEADTGRGRSRLPVGNLMQDSGIRTRAKGRCSTTEPPRCLWMKSLKHRVWDEQRP